MDQTRFTKPTALLDYNHPDLQRLIRNGSWPALPAYERIGAVYAFVRDEVLFGYNKRDEMRASEVLRQGYGQCNTKAILLMALLRAVAVPARLHGFTIDRSLQRGVIPELIYPITPARLVHTWVEILYQDEWIDLEGFILDVGYLSSLSSSFRDARSFCGYGVGTEDLRNPGIDWTGGDTYIQRTAITQDLGIHDSPDDFYRLHSQNLPWWKDILYSGLVRHWMNRRVRRIRNGGKAAQLPPAECARIPVGRIDRAKAGS